MCYSVSTLPLWLIATTERSRIFVNYLLFDVGISVPRFTPRRIIKCFLYRDVVQGVIRHWSREQVVQGSGVITVPESVQKACRWH